MEDTTIIILGMLVVVFGSFVVLLLTKFSKRKQRKSSNTVQEQNIETIIQSYENSMEILKNQNQFLVEDSKMAKRRLAAEIGVNLRNNQEELQNKEIKVTTKNLEENYEIDIKAALPLIKSLKSNIPFLKNMDDSKLPELINNPIAKKFAWDYIKKNQSEMIELGVIVPKGQVVETEQSETETDDTKKINGELQFSEANKEYMA